MSESKICILCGNSFIPKPHNRKYCNNAHIVKCRICGKDISLDGSINEQKRNMYIEKGYAYCSHLCSCKGIGIDKWDNENNNVDLNRLKYLKTQTDMSDKDIAKELNVSVDFVISRCERFKWAKPKKLEESRIQNKNAKISKVLKDKYKNIDIKQQMVNKCQQTYLNNTGYTHNSKNPESISKSQQTKLKRYGNYNI